jgi:hypothetical protein
MRSPAQVVISKRQPSLEKVGISDHLSLPLTHISRPCLKGNEQIPGNDVWTALGTGGKFDPVTSEMILPAVIMEP